MFLQEFCRWQYEQESDSLFICLPSAKKVKTTLKQAHLNQDGQSQDNRCRLSDFIHYQLFFEQIEKLALPLEVSEQLAYSAIASQLFLLPIQPQSWHFDVVNTTENVEIGNIARVLHKQEQKWYDVLVTQIEQQIATVLLLDQSLPLSRRQLNFGEPFRIFCNRLVSFDIKINQHYQLQRA